jgi:hypothetical protein
MAIGVTPKKRKIKKTEEKWSNENITIERGDNNIKDPTITALGLLGATISRRADIIILDDIVTQQNSDTEEQRKKVIDWVLNSVFPILTPGGKIIVAGNAWHAEDFNSLCVDGRLSRLFQYRKKLSAIVSDPIRKDLWQEWARILDRKDIPVEQCQDIAESFYKDNEVALNEGLKLLWDGPYGYSYKELYLLELADSYSFARMYRCDTSKRDNQRIKEEWLDLAKQKGRNLKLQYAVREGLTMDLTTAGVDLAISQKTYADDTAILTLDRVRYGNDIIRPGDYVIRNIERGKFLPNETRLKIKNVNDFVQPMGIRVESVAYQESIVRDLLDMGQVNIRGHKTGGEKNDLEIGVNSLATLLENGKLIIPYDIEDPATIEISSKLVNELRNWPDGHSGDSLMALWFAYLEARDLTSTRIICPETTFRDNRINDGIQTLEQIDLEMMRKGEDERMKNQKIVF